jgi:hypothetical protein
MESYMRRYFAIIAVLVAVISASSACAEPVTYDFSVFSGYTFLGGSHTVAPGAGEVVTYQVTGDTSGIVADPYVPGGTQIPVTGEILVNGAFFTNITSAIDVFYDPTIGAIGVNIPVGPIDILDVTGLSLGAGFSLADSIGTTFGSTYIENNIAVNSSPEGLFQLYDPDSVDWFSATVTGSGNPVNPVTGAPGGNTVTPEPSSMLLLGTGLFGLGLVMFRKGRAGMDFSA